MKVLSLLQPWATLVVIGAKKIETRSWNTKYRGPVLIHASANRKSIGRKLAYTSPFLECLPKPTGAFNYDDLPHGAIIGQVKITETNRAENYLHTMGIDLFGEGERWKQEIAFGDYTDGRWGWVLKDHEKFSEPIPAKGALGLWTFMDNQHTEEHPCVFCGSHDVIITHSVDICNECGYVYS